MARASLALAAALAAAALLLLAAGPAAADAPASPAPGAPPKCPWGCATCQPYTPEELAALKAAREARRAARAEMKAAKAASDAANAAAPSGRRLAGADAVDSEDGEDAEDGRGEWGFGWGAGAGNGTRGGWRSGNWTHGNWTKQKCLSCADTTAYELKNGRCVCTAGYGIPMPPGLMSGQPPAERPRGPPPACAKCPAGTASGPLAPKPDWAALKAKWQAARAAAPGAADNARNGRKLLAEARAGKFGHGAPFCMACASGKSNDARTECL